MKIYIAGSSAPSERERVERWHKHLLRFGVEVVSTWLDSVAKHNGDGNPRELSVERRRDIVGKNLEEVAQADLLWFLVPPADAPTRGAWVEWGVALAAYTTKSKPLICSGDTKQSLFCSHGREFDDDVDAFLYILVATMATGQQVQTSGVYAYLLAFVEHMPTGPMIDSVTIVSCDAASLRAQHKHQRTIVEIGRFRAIDYRTARQIAWGAVTTDPQYAWMRGLMSPGNEC